MPTVCFIPQLKQVEVEQGTLLLEAASQVGVLIDASCNGVGTCGVCKVKVEGAQNVPLNEHELQHLSETEIEKGYRLACQLHVEGDYEVHVPAIHGGSSDRKKKVSLPDGFEMGERVSCVTARIPKAKMDYQVNDVDRIREALGKPDMKLAQGLVRGLHQELEQRRGELTLAFDGDTLVGVRAGNGGECYGVSFDVGTTTVVGMLWNLESGELVDVESRTNYQSLYGADVISRISYSMGSEKNLEVLQSKAMQCCNEILEEMCERDGIDAACIYEATFDGNTTMTHLALGVSPRPMSRTPFAPVFCEAQNVPASSIGLQINPSANAHFLPIIAGHVGGDIVGMMLAAGVDSLSGSHVAIDIGTNGEVVAVKDGRMLCCSTAAGPAFEGATIGWGMRAAAGAIERVSINNEGVSIATIDGAEPVGICGSGLIDAVAALLDAGVVKDSGKMLSCEEALSAGVPEAVAKNIIGSGMDVCFVLAEREGLDDIVLSQNDIREVQLAKGAILAGIQTLMLELGIVTEDLDSIMLAGAFGNYIDKVSALRIGLFPQVPAERVLPIGNAAGVGCCMTLLSRQEREHAQEIARAAKHIELSRNDDFQDFYMTAMTFKI